jgi:uncharacterized protein
MYDCPSRIPKKDDSSSRPIVGSATFTTVESRKTIPEPRTAAARVQRELVEVVINCFYSTGATFDRHYRPAMPTDHLTLADWRRRVSELYAQVRRESDARVAWDQWRKERDEMFGEHPQSPLPSTARERFRGLSYFDYDPAARVLATLQPAEPQRLEIPTSNDGTMAFDRIGTAHFDWKGNELHLDCFWLDAYSGGLFLSFRDSTSGSETYGAGRYLLDSAKGADLGTDGDRLILDFNFSYNPSCSYDPRWVCPLAPPANRLSVAVRAGERHIS